MWDLAYFIAMPLGAWLYNTGGYVLNFGTAVIIYAFACFIGLVKLRGFKEKIKKHDLTLKGKSINLTSLFQRFFEDLLSPMNLVESVKTTLKKRPGWKNIYILCMILLTFINDLPVWGGFSVEFMYMKRRFQWKVDKISYYSTFLSAASNIGLIASIPIFHYFNTDDNVIILLSLFFNIVFYVFKFVVKSADAFFASAALGCLINLFYAPIRVQVTRCVSAEELGKVNLNSRLNH